MCNNNALRSCVVCLKCFLSTLIRESIIIRVCFVHCPESFYYLSAKNTRKKKGALEQVYLLLHSCDFREGHTFQHKPPVSDDAVPAEHAGNDDDDDDDDDGLLERRRRETTGATTTLCFSIIVPTFFVYLFVLREGMEAFDR